MMIMHDEPESESEVEEKVSPAESIVDEIPMATPKTVTTRKPRADKGQARKPRQATATRRKAPVVTGDTVAEQLYKATKGAHEILALFISPDCALSDEMAHAEANSVAEIITRYDMESALKYLPWLSLIGVLGMAETPVIVAVMHKLKATKQERERIGHVVEMPDSAQPMTGTNNVVVIPTLPPNS